MNLLVVLACIALGLYLLPVALTIVGAVIIAAVGIIAIPFSLLAQLIRKLSRRW